MWRVVLGEGRGAGQFMRGYVSPEIPIRPEWCECRGTVALRAAEDLSVQRRGCRAALINHTRSLRTLYACGKITGWHRNYVTLPTIDDRHKKTRIFQDFPFARKPVSVGNCGKDAFHFLKHRTLSGNVYAICSKWGKTEETTDFSLCNSGI